MIKNKTSQENLTYLSSYVSKLIKQRFGKGPETCFTFIKGEYLLVHVRHFMTPGEDVLRENGDLTLAYKFRTSILNAILDDFLREVARVFDKDFDSFYSDWNYSTNTGILLFVEKSPTRHEQGEMDLDFRQQLNKLCANYHRVPDRVHLIRIQPNLYIAKCEGVMFELDWMLHRKNAVGILAERSLQLKQNYLQYKNQFEEVFNQTVEDVYLMWDFTLDKNYTVFYLKPV